MRTKINQRGLKGTVAALLTTYFLAVALSALAQCPPRGTEYFDGVTPPALPPGWVASQGVNVTGAPLWVTSNVASHSWPNDAFSTAPNNILDNRLDTPLFLADPFAVAISFQNNYNLESGRDGAVLEISSPNINGGAFTDITDPAVGGSSIPATTPSLAPRFRALLPGEWPGAEIRAVTYSLKPFWGMLRFRLLKQGCVFAWSRTTAEPPKAGGSIPLPF